MTREEAIEILENHPWKNEAMKMAIMAIKALEQEPCEDAISRQAVKDKYRESLVSNLKDGDRGIDLSKYAEEPYRAFCKFMDSIPSVTPKQKVGRWIPIKTRPMTEEEKEHYRELGWDDAFLDTIYDCDLPEDGQTVLITTKYGEVQTDTFYDDVEGALFETYSDDEDVLAWMPLPECYKED